MIPTGKHLALAAAVLRAQREAGLDDGHAILADDECFERLRALSDLVTVAKRLPDEYVERAQRVGELLAIARSRRASG
jgi:hypothetical protein